MGRVATNIGLKVAVIFFLLRIRVLVTDSYSELWTVVV